jgi:hypothetical protein
MRLSSGISRIGMLMKGKFQYSYKSELHWFIKLFKSPYYDL